MTLKATIPGVPDFYQGTELWDFSLVDPDNRRPVDFAAREAILDAGTADIASLSESWSDGRLKLAMDASSSGHAEALCEGLHRRRFQAACGRGQRIGGHVIAFARTHRSGAVIVVALRHFAPLTDGGMIWPAFDRLDARVDLDNLSLIHPAGGGRELDLKHAFDRLPVALLSGANSCKGSRSLVPDGWLGAGTKVSQMEQRRYASRSRSHLGKASD